MKKNGKLLAIFCPLFLFAVPLLAVTNDLGAADPETIASHSTVAKPVLTITSPKAGQKLSNDVFTVTGTATDSAGISNVLCSFDQGAWTNADTGNQWTNWSVENITLVPGTNFFSAYAVDNNGRRSPTNTVKFVFVVTDVLTVLTNGPLTIKPNYNGAQLQIGENYSMTATADKGQKDFGFKNWTDGSNNLITTSATLKFLMASNLTFIANYGNILRPVIDVRNTTTNADGYPADFVVHGVASDKAGVTDVFYQLDMGAWQTATTTNNWTNWVADVELQPGANTFSAYAVNVNSNSSTMLTAQIDYDSAPSSLSGKSAIVTLDSTNNIAPFTVAFGKNTFSQVAGDTNNFNAVGSYTYTPSGGGGTLKFKYTGPPSATGEGSQTLGLTFYTPSFVLFTNVTMPNSGTMQFSSISNLALANVSGQLIWSISDAGNAQSVMFEKKTFTAQAFLSADTNSGDYTYTQYSPVGSLFKLTSTNGTSYVLANFAATNYGSYYEEDYDHSGHTNGTDNGSFLVGSQKPGGNAPLTVTNRNFEIFSGSDSFNDQFGMDTYSQDTLSTNFDNDVGDYTYTNISTNIGQLNLTVTAPPADGVSNVLAGATNAARFIFVSGNIGFFTNDDGTFSTFVMTAVTNLAPDGITNTTLNITNSPDGFNNQIQFAGDGSFQFNGSPGGTYTYAKFSPGGAMVDIDFTDTNGVVNGLDWLQLNFKSPGSGTFFVNEFDAGTNFLDNVGGNFGLQ